MPGILLSLDNLEFMKLASRPELPGMKSSHVTEALAFGLGYRTHAALLAAIRSAPSLRPILAHVDPVRLARRIVELGNAEINADFIVETVRSSNMPHPIWKEFAKGDLYANDRWFRECRDRNMPFICVERRRKYVKLGWDCISVDPNDEAHVRGRQGNELGRVMFKTFQTMARGTAGRPLYEGSSFVGVIDGLLPELAYDIAETFFAMLYQPMREQAAAA